MKVEKVVPEVVYRLELSAQDYEDLHSALALAEVKTNNDELGDRYGALWTVMYDGK